MTVQLIAETRNHQIMNDVEAETRLRHVTGKLASAVEFRLKPAHHSEAHQPAVEVVERTAEISRRGVVLSDDGFRRHRRLSFDCHHLRAGQHHAEISQQSAQ